jgi:hypothetical protein
LKIRPLFYQANPHPKILKTCARGLLGPSSDSGRGGLLAWSRIQNVPLIIIIVRDNPGAATVWTLAFVSRLFVENAFAIAFRTCLRLHGLPPLLG